MKGKYLFFITALFVNCQKPSSEDVQKCIKDVTYDGINFPEPKFDESIPAF
jgi:hypothetical protein